MLPIYAKSFSGDIRITVASRLSTHLFKYALFSQKNRVQIYLVQHVMDCHLTQVLKILAFDFQGDSSFTNIVLACYSLLLGASVLLSFAMISHRWDSLRRFSFDFFDIAAESNN